MRERLSERCLRELSPHLESRRMEGGGGGGGGGRRASSASDFFTRRHSSSFFQSMRRYSTNTVFGLTKAGVEGGSEAKPSESKNGGGAKNLGGRRHSAAVGGGLLKSGSSSPRSDKWRSLARVVLGNVDEGGEVAKQDETGDNQRKPGATNEGIIRNKKRKDLF